MQRSRDRVHRTLRVDIAATTPELTDLPDGLRDRATVGYAVAVL